MLAITFLFNYFDSNWAQLCDPLVHLRDRALEGGVSQDRNERDRQLEQ
jgi:hypothetical protein